MAQSHETQTPEQNYSTEQINDALEFAQRAVDGLRHDMSFHQACLERGIDPVHDNSSADYWNTFRFYVGERTDQERANGRDKLTMDAAELISATPAYLLEQSRLNNGHHQNPDERHYAKEVVSYYNGMIRDFALNYPEASVTGVRRNLQDVLSHTIHNHRVKEAATADVAATLRGAQHELAFGQVLSYTGLPYRGASLPEDLKGIDYVLGDESEPTYIDVKASLSEIEHRGSEGLFAVKPDGKVVMYSMALDVEFNDRFFIAPESAEVKAQQFMSEYGRMQQLKTA